MRLLTDHYHPIGTLTFSPDGRRLLATSHGDYVLFQPGAVRLWDLAAGTSQVLPPEALHPVFTPDARSVLYVGEEGGTPQSSLRLFDLASETSAPLTVPGPEADDFERPLFTPDGSRLLSFGWEWRRGRRCLVLNWTAYPCWQPIGQWRVNRRTDPALAGLNTFAAAFSPCGRTLTVATALGLVGFDVGTGARTHSRKVGPRQFARFLAYHPDGRQVAFGSDTKVAVFETRTWDAVAELRQRNHFLSGAFTPDGRRFLTASNAETVKCWDTGTWTLAREYAWGVGGLRSVAVAPDGMTAAAGGDNSDVVLFDLDD
jgi:WD40 repeat protein